MDEVIRQMLRALETEAAARRGIEGGERIELSGGRRVDSESVHAHTYHFVAHGKRRVRYGEAVHLILPRREAVAVVTASDHAERVELTVDSDLGLTVPCATMVCDDAFLIEALREQLHWAWRRKRPFNWELAERLLQPERWTKAGPAEIRGGTDPDLNKEQRRAVACMAKEGVTVIWGPPGTGKTRTVAAGVEEAWHQDRRIYLLAHTNVAVDTLLAQTLDRLGDDGVPDGAVIRIGELASGSLKARFGERVRFDAVVARRREPIERELRRLGEEIAPLRVALRASLECDASRGAEARTTRGRLAKLEDEAEALECAYERVPAEVVAGARIVATTLHRAYLPGYLHRQADLVVVDEASMAPLPMSIYAAGLARYSAVFAGDPRQLGSIVQSRDTAVRRWVGSSVFDPPTASRGVEPVLLRTQYRMDAEIAALLNRTSYPAGTLTTPACVLGRPFPDLPGLSGPISYVDTSALGARARIPVGTHTRVNERHARIVADLIARVRFEGDARVSVAVITPFRGQARLIRRSLPPELDDVACDTVHRFQGEERDLVILDLADSPGASLSRFMRASDPLAAGSRLLTVALSRARSHLVVVANGRFLMEQSPRHAFVRRLLRAVASGSGCESACQHPASPSPPADNARRTRLSL